MCFRVGEAHAEIFLGLFDSIVFCRPRQQADGKPECHCFRDAFPFPMQSQTADFSLNRLFFRGSEIILYLDRF